MYYLQDKYKIKKKYKKSTGDMGTPVKGPGAGEPWPWWAEIVQASGKCPAFRKGHGETQIFWEHITLQHKD